MQQLAFITRISANPEIKQKVCWYACTQRNFPEILQLLEDRNRVNNPYLSKYKFGINKMGGGSSSSAASHLNKSQNTVVALMMPLYYSGEDISVEERQFASDAWQLILHDTSPEYLARKTDPDFTYASCVTFFYDTFYLRLFDIHPMAKALFKSGMKSQGKFLVQMISLSLSELDDK